MRLLHRWADTRLRTECERLRGERDEYRRIARVLAGRVRELRDEKKEQHR
jgi:hypothetical protein